MKLIKDKWYYHPEYFIGNKSDPERYVIILRHYQILERKNGQWRLKVDYEVKGFRTERDMADFIEAKNMKELPNDVSKDYIPAGFKIIKKL